MAGTFKCAMCTSEFSDSSLLVRHVQTKHRDWEGSTFYKEFMEKVQAGKVGPSQHVAYRTPPAKNDISETQDASEEAEASKKSSSSDEPIETRDEPIELSEEDADAYKPEEEEATSEDAKPTTKKRRRSK